MPDEVIPGTKKVKFIPVKDGDLILEPKGRHTHGWDKGKTFVTDTNHLIGFKPGRAGKREGWLVYLVQQDRPRKGEVRKIRE